MSGSETEGKVHKNYRPVCWEDLCKDPEWRPRMRTHISRSIDVLFDRAQTVELRARAVETGKSKRASVYGGFFDGDHREQMADAAFELSTRGSARGVYVTAQEIRPELLTRRSNHCGDTTAPTRDHEVARYRWLLVDLDPKRPSGCSSTHEEHRTAHARAYHLSTTLQALGWPTPIYADSSNGAHLLWRVDLPVDGEHEALLKTALNVLATRFRTSLVRIDDATHDPARIWKLYGTPGRKGDDLPSRPYRVAQLLHVPDPCEIVTRALLERLGDDLASETPATRSSLKDVGSAADPGDASHNTRAPTISSQRQSSQEPDGATRVLKQLSIQEQLAVRDTAERIRAEPTRSAAAVDELRQRLAEIARKRRTLQQPLGCSAAELRQAHDDVVSQLRQRSQLGVATGIAPIDAQLSGLWGLTVLSAPPGAGKTSLSLSLALGALRNNEDVAAILITPDTNAHTTLRRLTCSLAALDERACCLAPPRSEAHALASTVTSSPDVAPRVAQAERDLFECFGARIHLITHPTRPTPADIIHVAEALQRAGTRRVVVIVDPGHAWRVVDDEGHAPRRGHARIRQHAARLRALLEALDPCSEGRAAVVATWGDHPRARRDGEPGAHLLSTPLGETADHVVRLEPRPSTRDLGASDDPTRRAEASDDPRQHVAESMDLDVIKARGPARRGVGPTLRWWFRQDRWEVLESPEG